MSLFPSPHIINSINPCRRFVPALVLLLILACGFSSARVHAQTNTNKWLQIPDASPNRLRSTSDALWPRPNLKS